MKSSATPYTSTSTESGGRSSRKFAQSKIYESHICHYGACCERVSCPGVPVMLASLLFVSSGSAFEGLSHKSYFPRFANSYLTSNRHLRALWSGPHRYSPFGGEL